MILNYGFGTMTATTFGSLLGLEQGWTPNTSPNPNIDPEP